MSKANTPLRKDLLVIMKRTTVLLDSLRCRAVVKGAKTLGASVLEVIRGLIDEGLLQRDYDRRWVREHDRKLTHVTSIAPAERGHRSC